MKKNLPLRIASVLLVAVLMTSSAVSGTFAKYASEATGTATVEIAKWSFKVGGTDIATSAQKTVTFGLFDTLKNTGATNVTKGKIAPGTKGSFQLTLVNASEVTATYKITLQQTGNTAVPIKFSTLDTTDASKWKSASEFSYSENIAIGETKYPTIYWKWDIDTNGSNHTQDTAIGTGSNRTLSVTASIYVEQVD